LHLVQQTDNSQAMDDNNYIDSNINRDIRSSMCSGLAERKARQVLGNRTIHADVAFKKDGPFYCPECLSDAIVRKCVDKKDHFAHKGRLSNLFGHGESQLHKDCKMEILVEMKKAFPEGNWEVERPIKENKEKGLAALVPDISGRINGKPVAIEVQRSFLNVRTITKRTEEYRKRGVAILWIIPLKEELGDEYFRPRLFEKFLHSMYFSRTYFWLKGFGARVLAAHFGRAERWIQETSWYDAEYQEEREAGGYWKVFRTIREPIFHQPKIDITKDFIIEHADEWLPDSEDLKVPQRLIFRDNLRKWWTDVPTRK